MQGRSSSDFGDAETSPRQILECGGEAMMDRAGTEQGLQQLWTWEASERNPGNVFSGILAIHIGIFTVLFSRYRKILEFSQFY